jgi:hypothetical protein
MIHFQGLGRVNVNAPTWNSAGSTASNILFAATRSKKRASFIEGFGFPAVWMLGLELVLELVLELCPEPEEAEV